VRKVIKHYSKGKKSPPRETEDDSTSEEAEPTPKVSKTMRRSKGGHSEQHGGHYFQSSAPEPERRTESRGDRGHQGGRSKQPDRRPSGDHGNGTIVPSHLRERPVNQDGRPVPPYNNSCFWCSTRYTNGLTIERHSKDCPSRKQNIRSCRGCHKDFKCSSNSPYMSRDYVRHICNCEHLRCRYCTTRNHHDVMVCPTKLGGCIGRNEICSCKSGHVRGFCPFDKDIPQWLRK
jgi:hypothetical protein